MLAGEVNPYCASAKSHLHYEPLLARWCLNIVFEFLVLRNGGTNNDGTSNLYYDAPHDTC